MKLIKPSFEILSSKGVLKDIELAARTCYQSQDKITEDDTSAIKLVQNLLTREHYAMIEFGENIVLVVDDDLLSDIFMIAHNPFFKGFHFTRTNTRTLLSMNPRTAIEFLDYYVNMVSLDSLNLEKLANSLYKTLPSLLVNTKNIGKYWNILGDGDFYDFYPILRQRELVSNLERNVHDTVTVRFICDRGVSHELVRHRLCSFAQKSTRYCDEKGDIEFIEPCWEWRTEGGNFRYGLYQSEAQYKLLREFDWKPEQARAVLPNALSTEIVMKTSIQEWKHIFKLRCDKAAHPSMRELMIPLEKEFKLRDLI